MRIAWSAAREANRLNWDDRAPLHEEAYDAHRFAADPDASHVDHDLAVLGQHLPGGTIAGLDVLHLQCHIGTDTISLARRGARVTGIDFSPASLEVADAAALPVEVEITTAIRKQSRGIKPGARLIFANIHKRLLTKWEALRIFAITPANSRQAMRNANILSRMPDIRAAWKRPLSL